MDYLDAIYQHSQLHRPQESRPTGWENATDAEWTICNRVAQLWCRGILPSGTWGDRIEKWCAGAGEILRYCANSRDAALRLIDEYHQYYEQNGLTFTVAGPQSLVNVLPPFIASRPVDPVMYLDQLITQWEMEDSCRD